MTRIGGHAWRRWAGWVGGTAAALVTLAALLSLAALATPGWYRPATVRPDEYPALRNELPNFGSAIGSHLERGQPFRITVLDEQVNRWLAARGEIWPGLRDALPRHMADPVVSFQPGQIVLAIRYDGQVSSVLSLSVNLEVEPARGAIRVRIDGLRAGYLPIPRALVAAQAGKALDREAARLINRTVGALWSQATGHVSDKASAKRPAVRQVPLAAMLGDIWEFRLPARNRWPNGGFTYSISDVRIESGKLMIDVVPAARAATRPGRATQPGA